MRTLLCGLSCAALCACATAPERPAPASAAIPDEPGAQASAYGLFLAGQASVQTGASAAAQDYFARAATLEGSATDRDLLSMRAFTAALMAGDITAAAAAAPTGPQADTGMRHIGALVRGVEALSTGKPRLARVVLTGPDSGAPNEPAAALLTPFAAAAAGDVEASLVQPVIKGEPVAQFFASLDQGLLFERAGRLDEAETAYRALIAKGDPGGAASLHLGELLERRGRPTEALAIYDRALAGSRGEDRLQAARARVAAHGKAPAQTPIRTAAADALVAPAAVLMLQKQQEIALAYLRLALRLDPTQDEAWLMVGDILAGVGDDAAARAAYEKPRPGSSQYLAARTKIAWSYQAAGEKDQALATAREILAAAPADPDAIITLADLLRADERFEESARTLEPLLASGHAPPDWKLLYMRAVDYEESGRWDLAEADLRAALKQQPDEPELLNFLGYSWIDRGERLSEALDMVKRAVSLEPQSGAMIDSLGWGYYRLGDYASAVSKLEEAVVLEPGDPDVNNHLGDAYWRVGRKVEAGYQWRRVLTLDPPAKLKAEVEAKIASGLEVPPPKASGPIVQASPPAAQLAVK